MIKLFMFSKSKPFLFLKKLFLTSLLFIMVSFISLNVKGQIIDLSNPDFIDVPGICNTDPTDTDCVITLPAYEYGNTYSFEIPVMAVLTRSLTNFTVDNIVFPCAFVVPFSSLSITTNGLLTLNMDSLCSLKLLNNDYEVTFDLNVAYDPTNLDPANEPAPESFKYKIIIGRHPVKVALVLDISGSMSITTSEGDRRWDVLQNCVNLFTRELENFRNEDNDSICVTYFTNSILDPASPLDPNINLITSNTASPRVSELIYNDIGGRDPLYSTAMGNGLLNGKSKLLHFQGIQQNKIVLLFTDGLQNVPPFVLEDGISLSNGDSLNKSTESIKYYTIATWGTGIVPEILDSISKNNNGVALQSGKVNNFQLQDFFMNQLQYMLFEGSPQIVESKRGILNYNEDTLIYPINKNITKVSIVLAFNTNDSINVKEILMGGVEVPLQSIVEKTGNFIFIDFELPIAESPSAPEYGKLKIVINGKTENEYMATALVDDHYLDVNCSTDQSQYTVGDSILLKTELLYVNQPLPDDNTVTAYIFKPGDDINHLLATFTTTDTTSYDDVDSEVDQKYINLLKTDTAFYNALLPDKQKVTLQHNANGIYEGYFTETELSGNYNVLFIASGTINESSNFKRSKTLTTIFRFGQVVQEEPVVEETTTTPDTTTGTGNQTGNVLVVTIRPINKYGYYMGPGFKSKIKYNIQFKNKKPLSTHHLKASLLTADNQVTDPYVKDFIDNLDGSYSIILADVPANANPYVTITVRGETLYDGKLFQIPWWFYLIIIIVILLLIILKKAKESSSVKLVRIILWILVVIFFILYVLHTLGIFRLFIL
ncbi:MAG: hypothetical protein KOO66_01505 [Bacteroidales bacterium]|nr:hypothetical protein [Bacteroidales bacterium]